MITGHMQDLDRRFAQGPLLICIALTVVAILRIVATYPSTSLAYDEPAHIACGMEWLDKGTFVLEPLHPPLARVAAAIGPYLAGARLPAVALVPGKGGASYDIYPAGNQILYTHNRYARNLALARLGELPFFILGVALTFFWTRSLYGSWAAVAGVLFYTTLPAILAFAGIAYVDFALSVLLPCALFAFIHWLANPSLKHGLILGIAGGLAVLANLSALLFIPVCIVPITACWIWRRNPSGTEKDGKYLAAIGIALLIASLTIWGGYRFSVTPLDEVFVKAADDVAQLPAPLRPVASAMIKINPPVPAPDFFKGILASWIQNRKSPPSYALGQIRRGGFWYFYWLDLGLKTPLPFLILAIAGVWVALRPSGDWRVLAPAVSALAILLVSMVVKVDFGIRHILFIYPLLVVLASGAAIRLWSERHHLPLIAPTILILLLLSQIASSLSAHSDYIAYFNVLAGKTPEERLLFGCDLDCGQDVGRLAQSVRKRGISQLTLQLWTSADLTHMNLPPFHVLQPYQHATGWVAVSILYLRSGHGILGSISFDQYEWLNSYAPVEYVGKTIRLYHIAENSGSDSELTAPPSSK